MWAQEKPHLGWPPSLVRCSHPRDRQASLTALDLGAQSLLWLRLGLGISGCCCRGKGSCPCVDLAYLLVVHKQKRVSFHQLGTVIPTSRRPSKAEAWGLRPGLSWFLESSWMTRGCGLRVLQPGAQLDLSSVLSVEQLLSGANTPRPWPWGARGWVWGHCHFPPRLLSGMVSLQRPDQGWANLSLKGQTVGNLGFEGHTVRVLTTQDCGRSMKATMDIRNECVCPCGPKVSFSRRP